MVSIPGYRLVAQLASGSSGTVWRAVQERLDREVAVKVLEPGLFSEEETRRRFLREAKLQASLSHPNLLGLLDAGFAGGQPYLAMELAEGGTLRDLLARERQVDYPKALRIAAEIAHGLAHAHERGIVHRDLKPENVLFSATGEAKVADFGLAKSTSTTHTVQTATGVILGTPGYIAPEAIRGESPGKAADIYALGVMLYEMIRGGAPFRGSDVADTLQRQLAGRAGAVPGWPEALNELVLGCLAVDPARRPGSAAEVADRIEALPPELPEVSQATIMMSGSRSVKRAPVPTMVRPVPSSKVRVVPPRLGFAAAGALLLAAGFLYYTSKPPPEPPAPVAPVSAEQLPDLLSTNVGAGRAMLRFGGPCPPGVKLTYWKAGTGQRTTVDVRAGESSFSLAKLETGTPYAGELSAGSSARPLSWKTIAPDRSTGGLPIAQGHWEKWDVAWNGTRVAVAWAEIESEKKIVLKTRISPDLGETWEPIEKAADMELDDHFGLVATPKGVTVGWLSWKESPQYARLRLAFRAWESNAWTALSSLDGLDRASGLLLAAGGSDEVDCLVWRAVPPATRQCWFRFTAGRTVPPEALAKAEVLPILNYSQLVRAGDALHAVGRTWDPEDRALHWICKKGTGPISQPVPVTYPNSEPGSRETDAEPFGDKMFITMAAWDLMQLWSFSPAGLKVTGPMEPRKTRVAQIRPSLAADGPRLYLGHAEGQLIGVVAQILIHESFDGTAWHLVAARGVASDDVLGPMRIVAAGGRYLAMLNSSLHHRITAVPIPPVRER